jgi:hypothetical protein
LTMLERCGIILSNRIERGKGNEQAESGAQNPSDKGPL